MSGGRRVRDMAPWVSSAFLQSVLHDKALGRRASVSSDALRLLICDLSLCHLADYARIPRNPAMRRRCADGLRWLRRQGD